MTALINSTYITLDGVIENPQNWPSLGGATGEGSRVQAQLLDGCAGIVMGRHTYESFAPVFTATAGDPVSDRMNALPKYVVSSTLRDPQWQHTTVVDHDPVPTIAGIKDAADGHLVQYGFGQLSRALLADGLLDELRLWVHPFLLGAGTSDDLLFRAGCAGRFALSDVTTLDSGIVILSYRAS